MENLFELQTRIMCDLLPDESLDALYLYGQTSDNEASVFGLAKEFLQQGRAKKLLISQQGAVSGYPGYQKWLESLRAMGIEDSKIESVPLIEPMIHTLNESEALIEYLLRNNYQRVAIAAAPFHQLRAFMTAVSVALKKMPFIQLYSIPGKSLSWMEEVKHSQGKLLGTRMDLIHGELERIHKYQKKGDLGKTESVLAYLNKRD